MKIVYISNSIIPSRAANSIHVMKMCQAFSDGGNEVLLLAPDRKEDYESGIDDLYKYYGVKNNFNIHKILWLSRVKGQKYIYGFIAAINALTAKPDLVFCRDLVSCYFAALCGLSVVYESHSPAIASGKASEWVFKKLIKSKQLKTLVVITESLKKYYEETYPLLKGNIMVAPDGADPVPDDVIAIELSGKGSRLQVGYVGHLYEGRGVDVIVELAKMCPWADFHFVGGTQEDIVHWADITKGQENIVFHGFKSPAEAERLRVAFDVLLAPYQQALKTFGGGNTVQWMSPLKAFEYMAAKKPIIISDLPVLKEIFTHKENALLCRPDNVKEWRLALEELRNNPALAKSLQNRAFDDFIKGLTWKARSENLLNYIQLK